MTETPTQYSEGYAARARGDGRDFCPYGRIEMELRHWWYAGWHDADIAIESRTKQSRRVQHG